MSGAGISANVSISGCSARSGAIERAPVSGSPSATASIITILRPRSWSGSHSMSGTWKIRATLVTDSGASAVHSPHAVSTRWACRQSHASMPAYAVRTGSRSNSSAVTTPKPPLPPRAAQSRSASWSSVARTNVPSASTSSTAVIALHCRPCWREYQLTPPPSDEPTTPTPGLDMCCPASPTRPARVMTSPHSTPASARAVRLAPSTRSPVMAEVRSSTASPSRPARGGAPWPVPCGATRRPAAAAARTIRATSWGSAG